MTLQNEAANVHERNVQPELAVEAKDLAFSYGRFPVLKDIDFSLPMGEAVVITGENGCGKSTLLKVIIGQLEANEGSLTVMGQKVRAERPLKEVGYVPQANVMARISFPVTVQELAVQGLAREFGPVKIPRKQHLQRTAEAIEKMGLEDFLHVPFSELSGGLQQRVMITRALLADPKLLVLDEPTTGVDKESRADFLDILHGLNKDEGITILIVTHDVDTVHHHLDVSTTYLLEDGRLTK